MMGYAVDGKFFHHLSMEFVRAQNKYPYDSCDRDFPEVIIQIHQ